MIRRQGRLAPTQTEYPPRMPAPYESRLPYERTRIHAAAIYCSDGRIGEHFDDFLQSGLGLPRYDRVALPGGPACLAGHPQARLELKEPRLELVQRADLVRATAFVHRVTGLDVIEGYFARLSEGRIRFER